MTDLQFRNTDLLRVGRQRPLHPRVRITDPDNASPEGCFVLEIGGTADLSAADGQQTLSPTPTDAWTIYNSVGSALAAVDQLTGDRPGLRHQLEIQVAGGFWIEMTDTGIFGKPAARQSADPDRIDRTG